MIIKLLNNNNTIWKPFVNPHFQSKAGRKLKELQKVPCSVALNKDCISKNAPALFGSEHFKMCINLLSGKLSSGLLRR
jgi:hypothetical protein